ncbi:MAG: FAD-dependent tricarballylate dehydrogenase TcuA [Acidimicrobiales bacterium]|nr:FAD-dependent tricarballylate dehydrogenase TcuA [Acidimicrobiales bacterium]
MQEQRSVDVIVVGAGNAALVAALAAHEAGASVLVLEAAPKEQRGGNSRFSGGIFRFAHGGLDDIRPLLTEEGARWADRVTVEPYQPTRFHADIDLVCESRSDPELISTLIDTSYETMAWMRDRGVRWELVTDKLFDPAKIPAGTTYAVPPGGAVRATNEGIGLMYDLFNAVEAAGIDVWYDAPVQQLRMEGSRCVGVQVRRGDRFEDVGAGAVVLGCGGFESNPELRLRYLGPGWDLVKVRGTRFNMGHVLMQALAAGAAPAGHWGGAHASPLDAHAPDVGELSLTDRMSRYSYPYCLLVDRNGNRFVDEGEDEVWLTYAKTGWAIRAQQGARAWQIFDQKTIHLLEPRYSTGTPVEAGSLEDLAAKLGINQRGLLETVARFNASCAEAAGAAFDPFHKDGLAAHPAEQPAKSNWAQPIDTAPYVAYAVTCGITFTYGGLKIDRTARVIDTVGQPMGGLFATGEIAGGFFFHNYAAGSGLMRGATFGRIAGARAAEAARAGVGSAAGG